MNNVEAISQSSVDNLISKAMEGKYLTFHLASEEYGFEILKVREIIGLMEITQVPRTPHYIRGVINLRGKVIPVVDLRLKFGIDGQEDTEETCIIVVDITKAEGSIAMGVLVDGVSEVLDIQQEEIEDTPAFGAGVDVDYILGIGKIKNSVKILLDIDKVLGSSDVAMIDDSNSEQADVSYQNNEEKVLEIS